jgi:hypothetical protein
MALLISRINVNTIEIVCMLSENINFICTTVVLIFFEGVHFHVGMYNVAVSYRSPYINLVPETLD